MTTLPPINTSVAASVAAAEGQAALGVGDTALARKKYGEAGAILERDMKAHHGGSEKQLLRFLAATQYYKGGEYQKAQELATKIDARALPKNVRGLLPQFLKDVKERSSPGYAMSIRRTVHALWLEGKSREAIVCLQNHPHIFDPAGLAFMRAVLCARLGDYRAATLFFRSVIQLAPTETETIFMTAAHPLGLISQGRILEAWECVQQQLELLPHPVTYITASIVDYRRFVSATPENRQQWAEEQFGFVERAFHAYQQLPAEQQMHPDMRGYMAYGFELAAATWLHLGNKERGKETWDLAVRLGANAASPWPTRVFSPSSTEPASRVSEVEYLAERERHFLAKFDRESSNRQLEALRA